MTVPDVLTPHPSTATRRRSWRLLGLVALLVALYLAVWIAYTNAGLVRLSKLEPVAAGATARIKGADFRVLSIVKTEELQDQSDYPDAVPLDPDTVWVIADVEVTRHEEVEYFICGVNLLGPDRRQWEPALAPASRKVPTYCDKDKLVNGQPYRFAPIFSIPTKYADQLLGLVVPNADEPIPVLRPPA